MKAAWTNLPRASLALIVVVAAFASAWAPRAGAATLTGPVATSPQAVRDYWTMRRMLAAEEVEQPPAGPVPRSAGERSPDPEDAAYVPADGAPAAIRSGSPPEPGRAIPVGVDRREVSDPAAPEVRMHGKVFFTITSGPDAGDRVCSGTVVNSRKRSLVWTAGHCVFDRDSSGGFATNWVFVPAFSAADGAPYGEWPAKRLATTSGWKTGSNYRYDLGAAVVAKNENGRRLQKIVGARGIGFDQPRDQRYSAFGYPAVGNPIEFTGSREWRCLSGNAGSDSPVGSGPSTMAIHCDMLGGASGGGWISGETLLSVTSYGYVIEPNVLYGPYLSKGAKALYRKVGGRKKRKRGGRDGRGGRAPTGRWTHSLSGG